MSMAYIFIAYIVMAYTVMALYSCGLYIYSAFEGGEALADRAMHIDCAAAPRTGPEPIYIKGQNSYGEMQPGGGCRMFDGCVGVDG